MPLLAAALAAGYGSSQGSGAILGPPNYHGFSANVTNPWFPLRPGSVYRYRGVKDGKPSHDVMTVTHRIRTATSGTSASGRPSSTRTGM